MERCDFLYWSGGMNIFPAKIKVIKIRVYGFNGGLGEDGCCVGVVVHVCGGMGLNSQSYIRR